jgi:hypothetical protein
VPNSLNIKDFGIFLVKQIPTTLKDLWYNRINESEEKKKEGKRRPSLSAKSARIRAILIISLDLFLLCRLFLRFPHKIHGHGF